MAEVFLEEVNKIFQGSIPCKKSWWEFWKPAFRKAEVCAVKNANIKIKDGEFMVLVGPSGCGKTTTLRMIAGLEEITQGKIYIDKRLVNDLSPKDRDIAMVFQNYALYPHMNVYENMAFGLRLRKFPKTEIDKRVKETSSLLGIEKLLHRKPKELSGGQKQRVAMGRAIVREPKVFLMDEPLSNLDAKLRAEMRAELQKLHQRLRVTTIYVTHDQMEAMTLGQRIVLMKDGIIQQVDTPLNIYENPANQFVAGFIGSPSMNFINLKVLRSPNGMGLLLKNERFSLEVPSSNANLLTGYIDQEIIFGIRPEDIYDKMFSRGATPGNTLRAKVEVFEPMGSEVYLYLTIGSDSLVARVDPHTNAIVGQEMEIVFDLEKMHAFRKDTKLAINE
ncbi:MAG: sn-glycerol-3-phosphate ABC transporter ATP-binding protein UgpC [Armatimonadetes bacterium]|nr:sn-glycerol-3-phosphate ABC transporter ATP-binding protein UgpC [Armatimonadota bacterium]